MTYLWLLCTRNSLWQHDRQPMIACRWLLSRPAGRSEWSRWQYRHSLPLWHRSRAKNKHGRWPESREFRCENMFSWKSVHCKTCSESVFWTSDLCNLASLNCGLVEDVSPSCRAQGVPGYLRLAANWSCETSSTQRHLLRERLRRLQGQPCKECPAKRRPKICAIWLYYHIHICISDHIWISVHLLTTYNNTWHVLVFLAILRLINLIG